jgi:hypothetical protein
VLKTSRSDHIASERLDAWVAQLALQATQILQGRRSPRTKGRVLGPLGEVGRDPQRRLVASCADVCEESLLQPGRPSHAAVVEPGTRAGRVDVMVPEAGVRGANEAEPGTPVAAKEELVDACHEADRRLVERVALDLPCRTTVWVKHRVTPAED